MPGLPPCLGLDLFEGVVSYDPALIQVFYQGEKVVQLFNPKPTHQTIQIQGDQCFE